MTIASGRTVLRSQDLFLKTHPALTAFCEAYTAFIEWTADAGGRVETPFAIVCERKEDVLAVRAQIFHALTQSTGSATARALAGITTYTLDSLARGLAQWAHLALRQRNSLPEFQGTLWSDAPVVETLGALTPPMLALPFLDVVTQEKLVRQILFACGYSGSDALPLAKQILALIDHPLPEGIRLADFLSPLESRHIAAPMDEAYLSSAALLLCALQITENTLDGQNFLRAQTLLRQGFARTSQDTLEHLVGRLPPKIAALQGTLLWVEAPRYRYSDTPEGQDYKPGNYSADVSADLLTLCEHLRRIVLAPQNSESEVPSFDHSLIVAETVITAPHESSTDTSTAIESLVVCQSLTGFYETVAQELAKDDDAFALLGDVPLEHLRVLHPAAAGRYAVCESEIETFLTLMDGPTVPSHGSLEDTSPTTYHALPVEAHEALMTLWNEQLLLEDMLGKTLPVREKILRAYGLESTATQRAERFRFAARDLSYKARGTSPAPAPLEQLPQALSFLATDAVPQRLVVFGKPHGSRQPSFNVRILNQIFVALRKQGAAITPPASDLMYKVFWRSLFLGPLPVTIYLAEPDDVHEVELVLKLKDSLAAKVRRTPILANPSHTETWGETWGEANLQLMDFLKRGLPSSLGEAHCPTWPSVRNAVRQARGQKPTAHDHLSVTAFADYVSCPLMFFLRHVLTLGGQEHDPISYDRLASGTRLHETLELLTGSLSLLLTHPSGDPASMAIFTESFLKEWLQELRTPKILTHPDPVTFETAAAVAIDRARKRLASEPAQESVPHHIEESACALFLKSLKLPIASLCTPQDIEFRQRLGTEARKRMFLAFLDAEAKRLAEDRAQGRWRRIAHVERPIEIRLGGSDTPEVSAPLTLRGKIDRIDHIYARSTELGAPHRQHERIGIEIIDYKTSTPKEQINQLILFPDQLLASKASSQMSVQGGLYLSAILEEQTSGNPSEPSELSCLAVPLSFSLFRLGSLRSEAPLVLTASVPVHTPEGQRELESGRQAYNAIADRLQAGHFPAAPNEASLCQICEFRVQCPKANEGHAP